MKKQIINMITSIFFFAFMHAKQPEQQIHPLCIHIINKYCLSYAAFEKIKLEDIPKHKTFLDECLYHAGLRQCIIDLHAEDYEKRAHAQKILRDIQEYLKKHITYFENYKPIYYQRTKPWAITLSISFISTCVYGIGAFSDNDTIYDASISGLIVSGAICYCSFIVLLIKNTTGFININTYQQELEKICLSIDELIVT